MYKNLQLCQHKLTGVYFIFWYLGVYRQLRIVIVIITRNKILSKARSTVYLDFTAPLLNKLPLFYGIWSENIMIVRSRNSVLSIT